MLWMIPMAWAGQAERLASERNAGQHVLDAARVLPVAESGQLQLQAQGLEEELGVWIQFVTVPNVEEGSALDLGLALSQALGLNASAHENDVVVLLVSETNQLEVVVGRGLRPVYSVPWEEQLMQAYVYPELERGQGASALVRWLHKVDARLRLLGSDARAGATAPNFGQPLPAPPLDLSPLFWGLGTLAFSVGLGAAATALLRRRFCFNHPFPQPMFALSEELQGPFLTAQQRIENGVDPLRFEVLSCPACQQKRVISRALGILD